MHCHTGLAALGMLTTCLSALAADPVVRTPKTDHWAFRPPVHPALPAVKNATWGRTPVDAFVLAALEKQGLDPAAPAARHTLLRRVYLDLIGLPPTPDEQRAYLEDPAPDPLARVVDDLLARPQYGERWGRHWLDVARYAETNGYERDGAKPHAWRYRDYVIDAFNSDKPFNRFLTEQLAGDELDSSTAESQIATTFLRLGTWDDEPAEPLVDRYDQLDDVLGTTATAFLGLTLRCARCHDHKFEPFTQVDYARMLAVFEPLKRPQRARADLDRFVGSQAELAAYRNAVVPLAIEAVGSRGRIAALAALLPGRRPPEPPRAYVWYEEGPQAPPTRVQRRGDPHRPAQEVSPGLPVVLVPSPPAPPKPLARSTGRRLWLANWLTAPDNPLVARVLVNRVWQHHFGEGLVTTSNDFGVMGDVPSHPDLLDWLATEFIASGWRVKELHRLLVLSSTYRMSSAFQAGAARVDPRARLLWRWRQRRLEAEAVRDSVLAVSGQLNMEGPGSGRPHVYPALPRAVLEGQSRPGDGWGQSDERQQSRRSVYVFVKRVLAVPELEQLDTPDTTSSCEQRLVSTVAPQALTLLNGDFMQRQARHFAERLRREAGDDALAQVRRAFELALCRPPRPEELRAAAEFLPRHQRQIERDAGQDRVDAVQRALQAFCLVLLNANEFVYWD